MNAFEKLCRLAAAANWCWKLPCTTCGNHHLRCGLTLIAHNVPLEKWNHRTTDWPSDLIPFNRGKIPLKQGQSAHLSGLLGAASLSAIRENWLESVALRTVGREDWLGYLGVALARARLAPLHRRQVGLEWRSQLDRIAGIASTSDPEPVTWEELEHYEQLLLSRHP